MESIYNYTLNELTNIFLELGSKKYYAEILYDWLYNKRIKSFDKITNIKNCLITKDDLIKVKNKLKGSEYNSMSAVMKNLSYYMTHKELFNTDTWTKKYINMKYPDILHFCNNNINNKPNICLYGPNTKK